MHLEKRKTMRKILCILLVVISSVVHAQDDAPADTIDRLAPDFVTASICTADPTDWRDDFLGVLGHAFIRLQCPSIGLDYCFSYESENASENWGKFLTGRLEMGLFAIPTQEYVQSYRDWNRSVHEYTLNLSPEAELRLWEIMDKHLGAGLPFDLTAHGCTQTLVQFVTKALGDTPIIYGEWPEEFALTRKEMLYRTLESYPWIRASVFPFLFDERMDAPCSNEEKIIQPSQITEIWQKAMVDGKPLLTYRGDLVVGEDVQVEKPWFTPAKAGIALLCILLLAAYLIILRRKKGAKKA